MRYALASLGLAALLWPASVQGQAQGPFGATMGSPLSNYPSCKRLEGAPTYYTCNTLPNPDASFELYAIRAVPRAGVCFVKAIGKDIRQDARGVATRAELRKLALQVEQTYGPHSALMDRIFSSSALKAEDEWLLAVERDERTFSYHWTKGNYPNGVDKIHVLAAATSAQTGFVVVEFHFRNENACDDALEMGEYYPLNQ